jgi:pimeloyl-ACP methyl ester carboxylesterase
VIAGRLATLQPSRLISIAYVASLPLLEGDTYMEPFAQESVKELEGELPFKSLVVRLQAPGTTPPTDEEIRKAIAPLVAANDVRAFAALWRGYRTLRVSNQQLTSVRVPSMVLVGSEDINAAGVPDLNKTHSQIRTLVIPGAQHGGPEGVLRRPEFMAALRAFLAGAR